MDEMESDEALRFYQFLNYLDGGSFGTGILHLIFIIQPLFTVSFFFYNDVSVIFRPNRRVCRCNVQISKLHEAAEQ